MEWTNKKTLEFLKLFKAEPCLWDVKLQPNKNRSAAHDAWRRIIESLSFTVTCDELKKKKESLMGYYRIHLNKYKKSLLSGNGDYTTNWFAFKLMDSFLRPIYETKILNTESFASTPEEYYTDINEHTEEFSQESIPGTSTCPPKIEFVSSQNIRTKPYRKPAAEVINTKTQMDAFGNLQTTVQKRKQYDEYDHFGFMIASKIRKIANADDREELMNTIHNTTFQFYMRSKQKNRPVQSPSLNSPSIKYSPRYENQDNSDTE